MSVRNTRYAKYLGIEFSTSALTVFVRDSGENGDFVTVPMKEKLFGMGSPPSTTGSSAFSSLTCSANSPAGPAGVGVRRSTWHSSSCRVPLWWFDLSTRTVDIGVHTNEVEFSKDLPMSTIYQRGPTSSHLLGNLHRFTTLILIAVLSGMSTSVAKIAYSAPKSSVPNIVLIMTDDQAPWAVGVHRGETHAEVETYPRLPEPYSRRTVRPHQRPGRNQKRYQRSRESQATRRPG
jgi:hypothetical protein